MIPIVTPAEMRDIDLAAPEPVDELVARAGAAVAWRARKMMGGIYGRRVVVIAGKGFNGADGRVAAERLRAWGARVEVFEADDTPDVLPEADLIIDAAYGTGLTRPYRPPQMGSTPVLAVDIPSGVNGLTGEIPGEAVHAHQTLTFAALKPGLLLSPGAALTGNVSVADIGLDVSRATAHQVEAADIASWLPRRSVDAHKWHSACWVIAGSAGMTGAAALASAAAARGGAGYVRLSVPGQTATAPVTSTASPSVAAEVVQQSLPAGDWALDAADIERFAALVLGPGLGRDAATSASVRQLLTSATIPVVLDADGLNAVGGELDILRRRPGPTILTPHDGEYGTLMGERPGADRFAAARLLAEASSCTVLLKGAATVVADPGGDVLVTTTGDARLATAGTGDVLAGLIGALVAAGMPPLRAAAAGAWIHGVAATRLPERGMVAGDLLAVLPEVFNAPHLG